MKKLPSLLVEMYNRLAAETTRAQTNPLAY